MEPLRDWLIERGWTGELATVAAVVAALAVAYLFGWVLRLLTRAPRARFLKSSVWREALDRRGVVPRAMRVFVVAVAIILINPLVEPWPRVLQWVETLFRALLVVSIAAAISAALSAGIDVLQHQRDRRQRLPFKALAQSAQMTVWVYASVALLSVLSGKDMWAVLTGLTAVGAVLVYVFRDPILGWTAAVQIATNDLLREGDWISVPDRGADGRVEEIALTSIKVRNWDRSVTAVPTYTLFSEGFRNWRGMLESGARRIQRAVAIDATSVRFCDAELLQRLAESPLVRQLQLATDFGEGLHDPLMEARLTNLGCFRAWLEAWLERHPLVEEDAPLLVREAAPDGRGIPVEFVAFTSELRGRHYEALQAEILDHMVAVLPRFDLRVFQEPTGEDLAAAARAPVDPGQVPDPVDTGST
jgi:miniconductance mechanosensitive channel